jgi:transcriptional regulator with XRE-family HTH domain
MSTRVTVADLVRKARQEKGTSLRAAASELGVAASTLSRVEHGDLRVSSSLGHRVASYYGVDPDLLDIAEGRLPDDIRRILLENPEELDRLRRTHGQSTVDEVAR